MKTIAVISGKGGVGKTTIARNLAVSALIANIPSAIIDADPQASTVKWASRRPVEMPLVRTPDPLEQTLEELRMGGAGLVVVDTAPHARANQMVIAKSVDFILIPTKPLVDDLEALGQTVEIVRSSGTKAGILFNMVPSGSASLYLARGAVAALGWPVCPIAVHNRMSHPYASAEGLTAQEREPSSKAAEESQMVWEWIHSLVWGAARKPKLKRAV